MTTIRKVLSVNDAGKRIIKRIRSKGFREIGSGAFADVYGHKTNKKYVYKVGVLDGTPSNDAYLCFAKKVIKQKNNPWLPRITELVIHQHDTSVVDDTDIWGYYVAKIERLQPIGRKDYEVISYTEKAIDAGKKKPYGVTITEDVDYNNAIKIIVACIKDGHTRDIHDGNIMKRKDGQLVFTDPVA
jgi:hypothetical protein